MHRAALISLVALTVACQGRILQPSGPADQDLHDGAPAGGDNGAGDAAGGDPVAGGDPAADGDPVAGGDPAAGGDSSGTGDAAGGDSAGGDAAGGDPSGFVTVADSGLSPATKAQMPYVYFESEVDTNGWPAIDVANASALSTAGIECAAMVADNPGVAQANSDNLQCILDDPQSERVLLQFTAGGVFWLGLPTSPLSGRIIYRPNRDHNYRALRSTVPGAKFTLRTNSNYPDTGTLEVFLGEDQDLLGSDLGWTGNTSRGDAQVLLASNGGLAVGDWLFLSADPTPEQPVNRVIWRAKVTSISAGGSPYTVSLDRPLPDDYSGGAPTAQEWSPCVGWSFEDMTIEHANPDHQRIYENHLMDVTNAAEWHFKNVTLIGYQYGLFVVDSARIRAEKIDGTLYFDKPYNNYFVTFAGVTGAMLLDSAIDSSESFVCGANGQSVLIAFTYIADPQPNPAYDPSGGEHDVVSHAGEHGPTGTCTDTNQGGNTPQDIPGADGQCDLRPSMATGPYYTHCSSGDEGDLLGMNGSAGCHGTRSPSAGGSILLHNASCSNMLVTRSHFEAGWWTDQFNGPGRYNMLYGSLGLADDNDLQGGGVGNGGDVGSKFGGGQPPPDYAMNHLFVNNSLNAMGSGSSGTMDVFSVDTRLEYNAIRDRCEWLGPLSDTDNQCVAGSAGWRNGFQEGPSSNTVVVSSRVPTRDVVGLRMYKEDSSEFCIIASQVPGTSLTCSAPLATETWAPDGPRADGFVLPGQNLTWTENDVGLGAAAKDFGGLPTMPTAPGFDSPAGQAYYATLPGSKPYVGADQGGVTPGASQGCLPAFARYHGGCTQTPGP